MNAPEAVHDRRVRPGAFRKGYGGGANRPERCREPLSAPGSVIGSRQRYRLAATLSAPGNVIGSRQRYRLAAAPFSVQHQPHWY